MWGLPMAIKFMSMLFGSHLSFLCVDLKLEMCEMGVPRGCVVVLYLGCGVEFGFVVCGMCLVGTPQWFVKVHF